MSADKIVLLEFDDYGQVVLWYRPSMRLEVGDLTSRWLGQVEEGGRWRERGSLSHD